MSAMNDGGYTVELKGKKYRLLFTLNALEELQDKCGGYDKLPEVFNRVFENLLVNITKYGMPGSNYCGKYLC